MLLKSAKQRKSEKVYKAYEQIGDDYDIMNDIVSFGIHWAWKYQVAEEIRKGQYHRILDVCCGTGDMALLLAKQNPHAAVKGIDFSRQMLDLAKRRQKKKNLINVEFLKQNAEQIRFGNGYFDCVVISFGLRNVADYEKVLREIYRVLRPGGYIYCLDSSIPESKEMESVYRAYRNHVIPAVSTVLNGKGWDYRRLAGANKKFLTKKQLVGLMQKCGFQKVGFLSHLGGIAACHRGQKPQLYS